MTKTIRRLLIEGLHGRSDIDVDFPNPISIFMGPNGIGKSTTLNILVNALSRQWQRLARQSFHQVLIEFESGDTLTVTRAECQELSSIEISPRLQALATALAEEGLLGEVLESASSDEAAAARIEAKLPFQARDIRVLRNNLVQYGDAARSFIHLSEMAKLLRRNFTTKLVYLPTYRRIEQDISEVFSMSPLTLRRIQAEITDSVATNSNATYVELVRFGMDDIDRLLTSHTSEIKEYSRQEINSLSTRYLTAALQTRQNFDRDFFSSLSDSRIRDVLARVDDQELDKAQRSGLTALIKTLRNRETAGRLNRAQEHIAGYFPMLAATHDRISSRETALQSLATVLNRYISPGKIAQYDQTRYEFSIKDGGVAVPLAGLSSGEKQIVSLFATIMLADDRDLFVVIDEPELSLSVLWQEMLISDIMATAHCSKLIAVTHSPFVYGEKLAMFTRDLSDHTTAKDGR